MDDEPDDHQSFYQYVIHSRYVVEPGTSARHTATEMNILKCVLSTTCLILNLIACYLPYFIMRRRFPKPTLEQRTNLHRRMQHSYCLLISFGTGLMLGSIVLYAWPLTLLTFLDAATKHKVPKGYRVAELVMGTLILGLYLIERVLLVATGRVASSRDYLAPMDQTTFIFAKPVPGTAEEPAVKEHPHDAQRVARASVVVRPGVRRQQDDSSNYSVVNSGELGRAWHARMEAERNDAFIDNKVKAQPATSKKWNKQDGENETTEELSPTDEASRNKDASDQSAKGDAKSNKKLRERGAHYADKATRILRLVSFLFGACFCPFLEGVGIGFAQGPKGVCVLYFTIIVRELFANFLLGYQESLKKREVIDRHCYMVGAAVVLPIGMNIGMILMESTSGDFHDLVVTTLFTAALFMAAIFHGLAAVVRTVGHNRVLIILCPAVVMIGFFVSTLWEEAMDQAFRHSPFPPAQWLDVSELGSNAGLFRANKWFQTSQQGPSSLT